MGKQVDKQASPDVFLVYPPHENPPKKGGRFLTAAPLGLCYIASNARKQGLTVEGLDCNTECLNPAETAARIALHAPKTVGIYVTSPALFFVRQLIQELRGRGVSSAIAAGGPHVTADCKSSRMLGADACFRGEGELLFPKFCRDTISGVATANTSHHWKMAEAKTVDCGRIDSAKTVNCRGIDSPITVDCGEIEDISKLPHPARDVFSGEYAYTPFATSRGCPFRCAYCGMARTKHRKRTIEDIAAELASLRARGTKRIDILDDSFTADRQHAMDVADLMGDNGLAWACSTRADLADPELLEHMRQTGLKHISFGVESGDEDAREAMGKDISDREYESVFRQCRRLKVKTTAYGIIGGPWETMESAKKTFEFIGSLRPDDIMYSPMILHPGTELYRTALKDGTITEGCWGEYMLGGGMPVYPPKNAGIEWVMGAIEAENMRFYLTAGRILARIGSSGTSAELVENLAAGFVYLTRALDR